MAAYRIFLALLQAIELADPLQCAASIEVLPVELNVLPSALRWKALRVPEAGRSRSGSAVNADTCELVPLRMQQDQRQIGRNTLQRTFRRNPYCTSKPRGGAGSAAGIAQTTVICVGPKASNPARLQLQKK